ncbi:MAG: anaerobic ribonucleoside-triphosphate reductase activating protein [Clostridia bacterium]
MRYASIKKCDVANGTGIRVSLFVSGCHHHCKGCFNTDAWDFNFGNDFTEQTQEKILEALDKDYIQGLSLLGGEPLEYVNQKGLLPLVKKVKQRFPNKTIWCYTGYLFDDEVMGQMYKKWPETKELISNLDIIVDGKYDENLRDLRLKFKGSSNQRIIDVQKTLAQNEIVLANDI